MWIDGPDGKSYHCAICGINRCHHVDAYPTCEIWILEKAERLKRSSSKYPDSDFEMAAQAWGEYELNKLKEDRKNVRQK